MRLLSRTIVVCGLIGCFAGAGPVGSQQWEVKLLDVPNYRWYAGCFGTATGNLMGYWDRHGMADFYAGPTAGGVAPLNDVGGNVGIRSMWASKAGFDGRPVNELGHIDDYWLYYGSDSSYSYESTAEDPYVTAGRPEHEPDCVGDFIGLSQKHWTNMNGECDGNIDAYSFVYWDAAGQRRTNYTPSTTAGPPPRDIQSGLRAWTQYRGYDADVVTQLAEHDVNPNTPPGSGFTFADLKREIDAGYPVLVFLQRTNQLARSLGGMGRANPEIHGMMIYGYRELEYPGLSIKAVYCRTSWASSDSIEPYEWNSAPWVLGANLSIRGVIGYHPKPKVRSIERNQDEITLAWDGPSSRWYDQISGVTKDLHRYQIERAAAVDATEWTPVGEPTVNGTLTFADCTGCTMFYRVTLLPPAD